MFNGVTFWTEGGSSIGMGHVARSINIARALKAAGIPVSFLVNDEVPVAGLLDDAGLPYRVWALESPDPEGVTNRVVVIDTKKDVSRLATSLKMRGKRLLVVDNLTACGVSDCVVIPSLTFDKHEWAETGELPGGRLSNLCTGADYIIIGENFLRASKLEERGPSVDPLRVLVTMGGSDPNGLTEKIAGALHGMDALEVVVVMGPAFRPSKGFGRFMASAPAGFSFLSGVRDLAPLMARADMAFTAMGTTAYELAYMGVPSVLIGNYPEDVFDLEALESMGICRSLGFYRNVKDEDIRRITGRFIRNRGELKVISDDARKLIDGCGAERVADIISGLYYLDFSIDGKDEDSIVDGASHPDGVSHPGGVSHA
jgi:spore coat polysaccharide biosynthesis predicted glycosyltransferase SpsG